MAINYRAATKSDLDQIYKLIQSNVYFYTSFESEEALALITPHSYVAVSGDIVVGFSSLVEKNPNVLIGAMLVVHPEFRGMGIGKNLSLMRFEGIKDTTIVADCWIHPTSSHEVTSDILLKSVDFVELWHYKKPWESECNTTGFCKYHDSGGCHCDVKILAKHF